MKTNLLILSFIPLLWSCHSENHLSEKKDKALDQVLLLKVDYLTNTFEGGLEFVFSQQSDDFTIETEYKFADNWGYIRIKYKELGETLFEGTTYLDKVGEMIYPKDLLPANMFKAQITQDFVSPVNGFEKIFNPQNLDLDYFNAWHTVQSLLKTREYLKENPSQKVKLFLYTPCMGKANPQNWRWIIFLKK